MKRHQMLMLMLRDTMMTWLLGRLGKVQLQNQYAVASPAAIICSVRVRRVAHVLMAGSLKAQMANLMWCRSREDQRRDPEPVVPGSKGACLSSGNAEAHEGEPWSPLLIKRGLVLNTTYRKGQRCNYAASP